MNRPLIFLSIFSVVGSFLVTAASAAELHVKVVDPHSAAVAGARVAVYRASESTPAQVRITAGDGEASFHLDSQDPLRIQVLAPGFAEAWESSQSQSKQTSTIVVRLQLARASETIVVSATRTPVPQEDTAASVSLLSSAQLETMQPVATGDALRFLPGAVVNVAGQRGGLGSLFVEGGESRYNKVLLDDVPINDPGGTFNFSTVPLGETDRLEFLQGAQSTLYGSDAMTSVVEVFSRNGTTAIPELRFGGDGGNFGTAHGFVSFSGARSRFDYDAFSDQFNTNGQGPNADYTNALQGGNFGVQLNDRALFRVRLRHSNSRTGVPGEWDFNGTKLLTPDIDQRARANNFLGSAQLAISGPGQWQHRLTGFEYNSHRLNEDFISDQSCFGPPFDCPFTATAHLNRAGVIYEANYTPRSWAQTTAGFQFEDENGRFFTNSLTFPPPTYNAALRLNYETYVLQRLVWKRLTAIAGVRYVREDASGRTGNPPLAPGPSVGAPGINKAVPRVALSFLALKGGTVFSGTRLRFSYALGIKEARFEEEYAGPPFSIPNPNLQPERNRSFETGFEQGLLSGRFVLRAIYFNNSFRQQIDYSCCNEQFQGQYVNVNRSIAHGANVSFTGNISSHVHLESGYNYLSSQILVAPFASGLQQPGNPLLRRPKHSGSLLLTYLGSRFGANLGGSFVGRRTDSDFLGLTVGGQPITHAAGYALVNLGGWYAITSRLTAYVNVDNALNQHYNEVVGYPALSANFRAGLRFRIGGE